MPVANKGMDYHWSRFLNNDFYVYLVTSWRTPAKKEENKNAASKDKVTRKSNLQYFSQVKSIEDL